MHSFMLFLVFVLCNSILFVCPSPIEAFKQGSRRPSVSPTPISESSSSPVPSPEPSTSSVPSPGPSTRAKCSRNECYNHHPIEGPKPSTSPVPSPEPSTSPVPSPRPSTSPVPSPEPITSPVPSPEPSTSPAHLPGSEDSHVCTINLNGNPIDDCWRLCGRDWASNRQHLAKCGAGFGKNAIGGLNGTIYVVTDPSDDPHDPEIGTLRYGVIQDQPLWIIFARDMLIKLEKQLNINSFKTIDGRGVEVIITSNEGTCLEMTNVTNVIIHGIRIHECHEDGMTITNSSHVWVDHCSLSRCGDGLIDVIRGSTSITISNSHFTHHNKVMLLGRSDKDAEDKNMRVTVAYNHFGEGLKQRLPRCRFGYFHVVNNDYTHWVTYAIGGSANPTIYSQGNRFLNADTGATKTVTKRMNATEEEWETWNWRSEGDLFLNGTNFVESGSKSLTAYGKVTSLHALPSSLVPLMTRDAGVLLCQVGKCC